MKLYAAVLAGGSGTRFWPASTRDRPKQLLPLLGGAPLLRRAVDRLDGLVAPERIVVLTATRYVAATRELLEDLPGIEVVAEPEPRNTAAACALAAHLVHARDPDGIVLTLPSDHVVSPAEDLRAVLAAAAERADAADTLLTLGLRPTRAATGYGWINLGDETARRGARAIHAVARFEEKPDRPTAERFLADGGYLWNLGMFAWRPGTFLSELAHHRPGVAAPLAAAAAHLGTDGEADALEGAFGSIESISVDYAVLEHSDRVECVPCSFAWDDLGSLPAVARHLAADADGNASVGPLLALESSGCLTWSEGDRLTALLGVEDLIVVHANGVTLVAPRARAEEVRKLVAELGEQGLERFA